MTMLAIHNDTSAVIRIPTDYQLCQAEYEITSSAERLRYLAGENKVAKKPVMERIADNSSMRVLYLNPTADQVYSTWYCTEGNVYYGRRETIEQDATEEARGSGT